MVDAAQLVGVRMNVDQGLAGMIWRDQRVTIGRRFAEPRSDGEDQVGVADALLELGVGPIAELPGIDLTAIADRVLAPERSSDGNAVAEREIGEAVGSARAPVGAADDRYRIGRVLQKLEQRLKRSGVGRFGERPHAWAIGSLDLVAQHVLGKRKHDRAGASGSRYAISAGDIVGDAASVVTPVC